MKTGYLTMKAMYYIRRVVLLVCILSYSLVTAQVNVSHYNVLKSLQGTSLTAAGAAIQFSALGLPLTQPQQLRTATQSAKLYLKLDLGKDYVKGVSNWNFKIQVDVTCFNGQASPVNKTLIITEKAPELIQVADLMTFLPVNTLTVSVNSVSITNGAGLPVSNVLLSNYLNSSLRLSAEWHRNYNVDVRYTNGLMSGGPVIQAPTITNRLVTFNWQPAGVDAYPDYEVQILKIYNSDTSYQYNTNQIMAEVDWSKALRVETQSYANSITLTMAEGTGYYLWRVRPIGTYFKGGIANSENYGEWSYSLPTSTVTALFSKSALQNPLSNVTPYAFYFTDPDENINWIYSRVFTEGDNVYGANPTGLKSSEGMSYANGLLQSRQSQKYNSSEQTTIISQTLMDYSGRPALSTLPVPVAGHLNGYKLGFVRNANGDLYTATHFDADAKFNQPDVVSSGTNSAYRYYSSSSNSLSVNNTHVADAEGYAYKRTLFKTDGTNRVTEESGVGFAHALGLQSNGQGRTTRVLYGVPSEDELLRMFGDEAPKAESVIKTITIDQNNVVSVTYTSKEGKTIATALISDNSTALQPLNAMTSTLATTHVVNENKYVNGKTVASKRIVIPQNGTGVTLGYVINGLPGSGTVCPGGNCDFRMRLLLIDLKQGVTYRSDAVTGTTLQAMDDFTVSSGFSLPQNWQFVSVNAGASPSVIVPSGNVMNLNEGEYIVVKELFSGRSANYAEQVVNQAHEQTQVVVDAITAQMQAVNSASAQTAFMTFINTFTTLVNSYHTQANFNHTSSLPLINHLNIDLNVYPNFIFPEPSAFTFTFGPNALDNAFSDMTIKAGCCPAITVPVPKPPVCYVCEGSTSTTITPSSNLSIAQMTAANANTVNAVVPYGLNDFTVNVNWASLTMQQRADAVSSLVDREFIQPFKDKLTEEGFTPPQNHLWKYTPGFTFESLNRMLSNMLVAQYYTGRTVKHNGVWYAADYVEASKGYTLSVPVTSLTNLPFNYNCKRLWAIWRGAIELVFAEDPQLSDANVLNSFNDQNLFNSSGQDNSENEDNWLLDIALVKRFLQNQIRKKLEKFSEDGGADLSIERQEATTNLVNMFISEMGRQYASIIDGAVLPDYLDVNTTHSLTPKEYDYASFPVLPPGNIVTTLTLGTMSYTAPVLFEKTGLNSAAAVTFSCTGVGSYNQLYYPYVVKPEWQFKYFVYNVFNEASFIDDYSLIIPNQVSMDIERIYNLPGTYLPAGTNTSSLCSNPSAITYSIGSTTGTFYYTHENWNAADREQFYLLVQSAPACYKYKGIEFGKPLYDPGLPTCATKAELHARLMSDLDARKEACLNRKAEIKQALLTELANACYTVVPCVAGSGQVAEKEVNLMANAVIRTMTTQIDYVKNQYVTAVGSNTGATTACASPSLFTQNYGVTLCDLPTCSAEDCGAIVLYDNNTLAITASRKFKTVLYRDCDQKLLDMLERGNFLPAIQGYNGCPGRTVHEWEGKSNGPACSNPAIPGSPGLYGEKQFPGNAPPVKHKVYSNAQTIAPGP